MIRELLEESPRVTVVDMEAGLEHLSRGTPRHADALLVVAEPYFKSMETAGRIHALAAELGIGRVMTIANKIRTDADAAALRDYCDRHSMTIAATVPFDESVADADREGVAPMDLDATSPAMREIARFAAGCLQ